MPALRLCCGRSALARFKLQIRHSTLAVQDQLMAVKITRERPAKSSNLFSCQVDREAWGCIPVIGGNHICVK